MSWAALAVAALALAAAILLLVNCRRAMAALREVGDRQEFHRKALVSLHRQMQGRREAGGAGVALPNLHIGGSNAKMAKLRDADGKLVGSLSETYLYALLHMSPADMRKYEVSVRLIERRKGGAE